MDKSKSIDKRLETIETLLLSQKTVFNFTETANYTGLSTSYLYKLTSAKKIPFYKPMGKLTYFKKVEVDEWLLQNRSTTSSEIEDKAITYVTLNKGGLK